MASVSPQQAAAQPTWPGSAEPSVAYGSSATSLKTPTQVRNGVGLYTSASQQAARTPSVSLTSLLRRNEGGYARDLGAGVQKAQTQGGSDTLLMKPSVRDASLLAGKALSAHSHTLTHTLRTQKTKVKQKSQAGDGGRRLCERTTAHSPQKELHQGRRVPGAPRRNSGISRHRKVPFSDTAGRTTTGFLSYQTGAGKKPLLPCRRVYETPTLWRQQKPTVQVETVIWRFLVKFTSKLKMQNRETTPNA